LKPIGSDDHAGEKKSDNGRQAQFLKNKDNGNRRREDDDELS